MYLQIYRILMALAVASSLTACGIDLESYAEPLFALARDSGVADDDADAGKPEDQSD